jgi:hypothetical protein
MRLVLTIAATLLFVQSTRAEERDSSLPTEPSSGVHQRSDSYFGFALGYGRGGVRAGSDSASFGDLLDGFHPWPFAVTLRGGSTLSDQWLFGADLSVVRVQGSRTVDDFLLDGVTYPGRSDLSAFVQTTALSFVGTYFPWREGIFVRAGAGLASFQQELRTPGGPLRQSHLGLNGTAGLGWAFWVRTRLNVTLNLDASTQVFAWSDAGEPDRAHAFVGAVGLDWF